MTQCFSANFRRSGMRSPFICGTSMILTLFQSTYLKMNLCLTNLSPDRMSLMKSPLVYQLVADRCFLKSLILWIPRPLLYIWMPFLLHQLLQAFLLPFNLIIDKSSIICINFGTVSIWCLLGKLEPVLLASFIVRSSKYWIFYLNFRK